MTFNESFQYLLDSSTYPHTLVKYKEDFRDYWKEVVQDCCLNYHGGRYRHPDPLLQGFEQEFKALADSARDWFYRGIM